MMNMKVAMTIGCLSLAGLAGCCNCLIRTENNIAPYACAPHPYYCTADVWQDIVFTRKYHCGQCYIFMMWMWPVTVVDEVCEVALDTFFLPLDLMCLFTREDDVRERVPSMDVRIEIPDRTTFVQIIDDKNVPTVRTKAISTASAEVSTASVVGSSTYTVKEDDDIVSVSIKCGVSPSQLMYANGLKAGDRLKPGQILRLPPYACQPARETSTP